jgi:hypothetical protein
MTPQLASQPGTADCAAPKGAQIANAHLTEDQFGELFLATAGRGSSDAEAHLLLCEQCAAELAILRESLSFFRQASSAHAENELRLMPPMAVRRRALPFVEPAYMVAAAALFLAALLPMQALHRFVARPVPVVASVATGQPAESDQALLEDVDREASLSVPASMQALADPTTDGAAVQTSMQRKD